MQTYYPSLHFNQPLGHAAHASGTVNKTELELGEMRADGGQAGGLMKSKVVAMSEA